MLSVSTSDLSIESFCNRTDQRILETTAFDARDGWHQALTGELAKRRGPAAELPKSVRGDAWKLELEKALPEAYICRGPWVTPALK